ncbi:MAG: ABC transporter ATP-binding protein, partial [Oscillibacter sp.]|nr:ABC transporter ATP-binding protein [Oscillibacter sp.]
DEIRRIHRETGITILFVTHDINEALKLGTKVLVMNQGEVVQYASPEALRAHPAHAFVEKLLSRR